MLVGLRILNYTVITAGKALSECGCVSCSQFGQFAAEFADIVVHKDRASCICRQWAQAAPDVLGDKGLAINGRVSSWEPRGFTVSKLRDCKWLTQSQNSQSIYDLPDLPSARLKKECVSSN